MTKRQVTEQDFRMPEFRHAKPEDYEFRADGKLVRKDRWETGFRSIAGIVAGQGDRAEFEIEEIVDMVRQIQATHTTYSVASTLFVRECEQGDIAGTEGWSEVWELIDAPDGDPDGITAQSKGFFIDEEAAMVVKTFIELTKSSKGERMTTPDPCECVYATAENTPSVRSDHEVGGYLIRKCAYCCAKEISAFLDEHERLNPSPLADEIMLLSPGSIDHEAALKRSHIRAVLSKLSALERACR